ncbi:hypothetical protein [Zhihengliuella flava]|uniref:hypothetical protein n=1 Tax=Zhihengliuella flava TaxID=1285193 RepID=UPI001E5D705B|nr:hypothetical protein [Zhihengliuella flava]
MGLMAGMGVRALSGRRRAWAVKPPYNYTQVSSRNSWPFMMIGIGAVAVLSLPAIYFEGVGNEEMRQLWWNLPFIWLPLPFIALSFFWWPAKLAPRWYREWVARGGTRDVMPWTEEEIRAIRQEPPGRRRERTLKDIEKSRELVSGEDRP